MNGNGNTALYEAAEKDHLDIVTTLITAGADLNLVNGEGDTVLHAAVQAGHVAVVEALVNKGMDVDLLSKNKDPALRLSAVMIASHLGHIDILNIVLKCSRDINFRSRNGNRTALVYAIEGGNVDAARLLLSQEMIQPDLADSLGWTPLMYAVIREKVAMIPDLVSHGANLNWLTDSGHTPVTIAVRDNHTDTAKKLLSFRGVDVNVIPLYDGRAPLHHAVSWSNAELVELLIAYGADPHIRDNVNGLTALDYARYFNDRKILDLLKSSDPDKGVNSG